MSAQTTQCKLQPSASTDTTMTLQQQLLNVKFVQLAIIAKASLHRHHIHHHASQASIQMRVQQSVNIVVLGG